METSHRLRISVGQHSDRGRKPTNQDFQGVHIPDEPLLSSKGICIGLADGISSSQVSQVASESAVKAFLEDYYCTSEAWSVRTAARLIVSTAYENGSQDNLTVQVVRVDDVPNGSVAEIFEGLLELPFPPPLQARMRFEGYRIIREIHASHRSHVYLALDEASQSQVVIKVPSVDLQADAAYVERFLMEEWIARRINSPHVLKPCPQTRTRTFAYLVTEYIEGQTLAQSQGGCGDRTSTARPDLEGAAGVSPAGDVAPGSATREHHDRWRWHGEDHRF